ncbi:MAG: hypothetical protein JNL52_03065 [Flavobacteriales bacterium]|nr:hypothetical protein [Flavobacteriales bacterium]
MFKLYNRYGRPVEKSIITVFGADFESKDYRPINEFAWQETSFKLNAAFVLSLSYWLIQELWLRAILNEHEHLILLQTFSIISVLVGAFVTSYAFQLIIVHWPSMRKKYNQRNKIETYIASILLHWHDLNVELLGPHDRISEERGNYYEKWDPQNARHIHKLMVSKWDGGERVGTIDPFARNFYYQRERMREAAAKLLEHEDDLPWDFYNQIGTTLSFFTDDDQLFGKVNDTEQARLYALYRLTLVVGMYYRVAYKTVLADRHITPYLEIAIGHSSYQNVWDDALILERRHHVFNKRQSYP